MRYAFASNNSSFLFCYWYCYWWILVNYFYQRFIKPVLIFDQFKSAFFLLENHNNRSCIKMFCICPTRSNISRICPYFFQNKISWNWTLDLTRLFNSFPSFSLTDLYYNLVYFKPIFTVVTVTRTFAPQWWLITRILFWNTSFFVSITLITSSTTTTENIVPLVL